jgi:predicted ATPase
MGRTLSGRRRGAVYRGTLVAGIFKGGIETIKGCLQELHEAGYELLTTTFNIALVQGLVALGQFEQSVVLIDEAIQLVEQNGNRIYMPELLRMKGNILLSLPQPKSLEAEGCLKESLELSRRQGAIAWTLRTAIDLTELFAERHQREEAKLLLRSVLDGFVEGSETMDIGAARKLLETL